MRRASAGAALAALAASALLVGCSIGERSLDADEAESTIRETLEEQLGADVRSVDCPDSVEAEAGATFTCEATGGDGTTAAVAVEQLDDEGQIRFEAPLVHTGEVEEEIADGLADQLDGEFQVTCPDLVAAEEGEELTCEAESDGDVQDVNVTLTDDEGSFEWELDE